ncbi:MAG: hypothetical protein BWY91_02085 [bacterium ADurb.BinA028]|nr:MAG: hypothetical protein BWY91_02085 [bacterium ADurb.BinA028]
MVTKPTAKVSHGSEKTKKPRSRPNCGSVIPNGWALRQSRKVSHCDDAVSPVASPAMSGMTSVASRRIGSSASR